LSEGVEIALEDEPQRFRQRTFAWLRHRPGGVTTLEVIDFAAENNFDVVDITAYYIPGYVNYAMPTDFAGIDAYAAQIRQKCADVGLPISGTGVLNDFATTNQDSRELDVQRVKYWIEVAAAMGAPVMRVFSGPEFLSQVRDALEETRAG